VPAVSAATPAAAASAVRAQEWWLKGLHVTQAWHTSEGAGIIVAVLGTGVDPSHPDLAGNVISGPDFSGTAALGRAPGGSYWGVEGTAVAGIVAGHGYDGNWSLGVVGIAPAARVLSVRVTLEFDDPLASDQAISQRLPGAIAEGIRYAVDHGARVIDLPLDPGTLGLTSAGDPAAAGGSTAERAAVHYALSKNVLLVAPAGDDGQGSGIVNYPAAYPGVIAVGAIGRAGQLAVFSSRRSYTSLTAPGVDLVTPTPSGGYGYFSSTSTASGMVAGLAALILAKFPDLSVAQVTRALIESTASAAGGAVLPPVPARSDDGAGYGTADAVRALQMAALINAAAQPRRPVAAPSRTARPAPRAVTVTHQASAGTVAGSVLRDAVAAVAALIVLVVAALIVVRSRRGRRAPSGHARGQHEHVRPGRAQPGPPEPAPASASARAPAPAPAPGAAAVPSRTRRAQPAPGVADRWPSPSGWQGGSIGEIDRPAAAPSRPALAPARRIAPGYRASRSAAIPAGPPWEPAPDPGPTIGPLPVASASSPPPEPGSSIRVPGDMAVPDAASDPSAAESTPPPAFDLSTPPADFNLSTPLFGLTPAVFGFAAPAGPDAPTRESLDFAAAPVPGDHTATPAAGVAPSGGSGPDPPADPSYIWDLAATDVFPAVGPDRPAETAEPPDATLPDIAPPDAAPPDAAPPETVPPETVPPETGPPSPDDASGDGGN
jgi:Subtilase family